MTLQGLKKELAELRTAQVTNGAAAKLNKINIVRKSIARLLTVMNQTAKSNIRAKYANKPNDRLPKELRAKKTRAIRRRLSEKNTRVLATGQKGAVVKKTVVRLTVKEAKKLANFKKIRFAVKAE